MAEDYYETLGVGKSASRADIKKAYKRLAKKYHPDNSDTGDAERFKKINEAAAVLSDDSKRKQYDQFGNADAFKNAAGASGFDYSGFNFDDLGAQFGGDFGDIFDHLGDIFGGSFGFGNMRGRRSRRRERGNDLRYDIDITLEEAAFGVTKTIIFNRLGKCPDCKGTGAEKGSERTECTQCGGRGQIVKQQRTPFGIFQTSAICPKCGGEGNIIENRCRECDGTGLVREEKKLEIKIPPGIDDEMRLRVEGEGDAGPHGGIDGDLYVFVTLLKHKYFTRDGENIHLECPISISQAALGAEISVPTLTGKAKLKIPAGTQPGTIFRMKGKGIPSLRGDSIGDQRVKVKVKIPEKLSKKEKVLFEELESEAKKTGFFKNWF
jgi:molecular chaperone DnaJ